MSARKASAAISGHFRPGHGRCSRRGWRCYPGAWKAGALVATLALQPCFVDRAALGIVLHGDFHHDGPVVQRRRVVRQLQDAGGVAQLRELLLCNLDRLRVAVLEVEPVPQAPSLAGAGLDFERKFQVLSPVPSFVALSSLAVTIAS